MLGEEHQPDGDHGEVVAAQAQGEGPDDGAEQETEHDGYREVGEEGPLSLIAEVGRGVGTDGEEGCVAQAHLARVAREQVEPDGTHGVDGDEHEHAERVVGQGVRHVDEEGEHAQRRTPCAMDPEAGAARLFGRGRGCGGGAHPPGPGSAAAGQRHPLHHARHQTRRTSGSPYRPKGLTSRMITITT